jgi:hypothetical protein
MTISEISRRKSLVTRAVRFLMIFCLASNMAAPSKAQTPDDFPYEVELRPVTIPGLPGLHSFAFGQHNGRWLIVGGRTDGLHPRQPFDPLGILPTIF